MIRAATPNLNTARGLWIHRYVPPAERLQGVRLTQQRVIPHGGRGASATGGLCPVVVVETPESHRRPHFDRGKPNRIGTKREVDFQLAGGRY
jgi:hypothetical protein